MSDSPLRILLVEHNTADAEPLQSALLESRYGRFEVVHARRLADAISLLAGAAFDAILLDLDSPESQGLQSLEQIRPRAAKAPIIVLTRLADETLALGAMKQGAQDCLVKSELEPSQVARAVRYVIERTRAERESVDAERGLEPAVNAAQIGIWDWDLRTDKIVWSPMQARILGVEGRECTFETFDQCVHPDDRAETRKKARDAATSPEPFRHEYRVVWPDGSIHWIESRGRASFAPQGTPVRVMGTVMDITARKAADEAAKARDADFAHLSRISTMGQMASGLAHELNQPLGAILNYAGACVSQMETGSGSKLMALTTLRAVMDETRRAGAIIQRMRDFVRKKQPWSQSVDLNELAMRSLNMMQFELRRRRVRPVTELASELPPVVADAIQIEQVLVNLVYNAAESMDQANSGGNVTIGTALDAGSGHVRVSVTDTGPGIAPETLDRLFEPFFTTKPHGLGMGLNISRSIIENLGGNLTAAANPQGGMCFSFTLPIESGESTCKANQMQ